MANLGTMELIIILVIVILLFGVGRISEIAGEMGKAVRAFQDGVSGEKKEQDEERQI